MAKDLIAKLAERLDDLVKLKGILEMFDGVAFKLLLEQGYAKLEDYSPEIAAEFLNTVEEFLETDWEEMTDDAAKLLAEIVKKLVIPASK